MEGKRKRLETKPESPVSRVAHISQRNLPKIQI